MLVALSVHQNWRQSLDEELVKLAKLPEGSDSWTAHRPSPAVIKQAKDVADRFLSHVADTQVSHQIIAATSEGGLQIKWCKPQRELSFFVYPSPEEHIEFLFIRRDEHRAKKSGELVPGQFDHIISLFKD